MSSLFMVHLVLTLLPKLHQYACFCSYSVHIQLKKQTKQCYNYSFMQLCIRWAYFQSKTWPHFCTLPQVWCQREVWMWVPVRCSDSTSWWPSRASSSLSPWSYPEGWASTYSHKPQARGDINRANQHFRVHVLRSECAVCVFTVGVVPGGHLSNDGWEQARSRCRGVAQRHW